MTQVTKDAALTIIKALRAGTVPDQGLEHYAVGLDREMKVLREQMDYVAKGHGDIKFIRGDYGAGKTFLTSLVAAEALEREFVISKVVISSADTPMHKLEVVYRKICQGLTLPGNRTNALQHVVDRWLYGLEEQVVEIDKLDEEDEGFHEAVARRVDNQLHTIADKSGRFAACLKAYHRLAFQGDFNTARSLLDWLCGDPKVTAAVKKEAQVKGDVAREDVFTFLRGMLELFRKAGHPGFMLVLDEVETITRQRAPERKKALELLRELVDKVLGKELPGLFLLVTGTPDLFESGPGIRALQPLHDRVKVDFGDDPETDNLRQPQIRLRAFDVSRLELVAAKIRELYPADHPERLRQRVDDKFIDHLVDHFTKAFGGRIEVTPRLFLRALVDVLDRVDQHDHFDPYQQFELDKAQLVSMELRPEEEEALGKEMMI